MTVIGENDAVKYLRKRLETEIACKGLIQKAIIKSFKEALSVVSPYAVSAKTFSFKNLPKHKDIDKIIATMRDAIRKYITTLVSTVIAQREQLYDSQTDITPAFILSYSAYGASIDKKVDDYVNDLKAEFETWIALSIFFKWSQSKTVSEYSSALLNPYSNTALKTIGRSPKPGKLGKYTSAMSSLSRIAVIASASAQKLTDWQILSSNSSIIAIQVFRGSSYPCALCDSMVGFHTLSEDALPPYHPNCCCYAVPVSL